MKAIVVKLGSLGWLTIAALVAVGACARSAPPAVEQKASEVAAVVDATALLATLQGRPGSPLEAGVAQTINSASGGLKPTFPTAVTAGEPKPAKVVLPQQASGALHLEDLATGVAADVVLQGAQVVAGQVVNGYVVYPNAHASGAHVLQRPVAGGTEDYIAFETKPQTAQIAYDVTLGGGAGLRLVANTLEIIETSGAPRIRVAPPFIVGSDGVRTDATLAVAGCAIDTSPAAPWGRAVTPPGATTCTVKVSWPAASVLYPAVLDPRWVTTGSMGTARQDHTMTLLATGKVLVTGGRSTTGTTGLATAELYDKTTGTWTATGSMTGGRFLHRATQLNTGSNATTSGKVLISGGLNGTTSVNTAQLYNPTAGTWAAAGNLNIARHGHTATLLADGKVLASGGLGGTTTLQSAAIYNPASGSGSWAATTGPIPPTGQKNHTAVLLATPNQQLNNKVLLVGGNNGSATMAAVYLFDPAQSAFSTLASMPSAHEGHTMTVLADGKVLVTGGKNGSTTLNTTALFDPGFGPGSWSSAGTMTSPRSGHTATLLPASIVANGQVLLAGGNSGSATLSSAELFSGTSTWTATPAMPGTLQGHQAVLLGNNMVLAAGGLSSSSTVVSTAYLYDASFGLGCTSASQCPSGFCTNGVCCDTACNGGCGACNLAGHLGTCTALGNGTVCRTAAAGGCDVAETCNGSSLTCPSDGFASSSTVCRAAADVCDQAESCPGNSAACPADAKKANGTACADDGNACTTDTCNGSSVACQHAAGNAGTQCRAAADLCDLAATCSGSSSTCPPNLFKPSSTVCRGPAGECDIADNCTGSAAACPADAKKSPGTACTDDLNPCSTDTCNGSSAACQHPAGNAGTQCRAAVDLCDLAAICSGSSTTCPANGFKPSSTVCRGSAGECDVADNCTGSSANCPGDGKKASGTACTADTNVCTLDQCDGSTNACQHPAGNAGTQCRAAAADCDQPATCTGASTTCPANPFKPATTVCRAATGVCDVAENCTGSGTSCPGDTFASNGTSCGSGNACTNSGTCQAGVCNGGTPVDTSDGNPCTADSCDLVAGVLHVPVAAGIGCGGEPACSAAQVCDGLGACVTVDDTNSCTMDVCDPGQSIAHVPVAAGTPCANSPSCQGEATCNASGSCSACVVGQIQVQYHGNVVANAGQITIPSVLAGSRGVVVPLTVSNAGTGDLILSGNPNVTITGPHAADFSIQKFPASTLASGKSESIQLKFAPLAAGVRTASLQIISNDSANTPSSSR